MVKKDDRVDAYIANSADFAKPVLTHFRALVHKACPEAEEKIKWGFPNFDYAGKTMASMASFKEHCSIGFWKASLIKGLEAADKAGMGSLGRITGLKDLPSDKKILGYLKEAMVLNEKGIKVVKARPEPKKALDTPDYFQKALHKNKQALQVFEAFSPSKKRDYIEWITEAKTEETRLKRMTTALEWIAEGKSRNWKYEQK
jgi:uncharacterized protein YdeI (YjbR/CyaY-like superfamily)